MSTEVDLGTAAIKKTAAERAAAMRLPYAGALLPSEAQQLMGAGGKLVDVRTRAELDFVGRVPGSTFIEWNSYPEGRRNENFLAQLAQAVPKDAPVMFICRSGGRSHAAAATAAQAGWVEAYNVLEGFEGERDASGHRGTDGGGKVAGLPWVQG
jgi:rhodanese-related sulfurtransferase